MTSSYRQKARAAQVKSPEVDLFHDVAVHADPGKQESSACRRKVEAVTTAEGLLPIIQAVCARRAWPRGERTAEPPPRKVTNRDTRSSEAVLLEKSSPLNRGGKRENHLENRAAGSKTEDKFFESRLPAGFY